MRRAISFAFATAMIACGPATTSVPAGDPEPLTSAKPEASPPDWKSEVSRVRGLPFLSDVPVVTLDRDEVIRVLRENTNEEMPPDVLRDEVESLILIGMVPVDYDAVNGVYALLQASLAGFYDDKERRMVLLGDLGADARTETLVHEGVHALQDQHFRLGARLHYKSGQSEATSALHALAEGDATSAAFDATLGSAFEVPEKLFADRMAEAAETISPDTPGALRSTLISAYTDGFAFVQDLRRRGGFAAVNAAWNDPPTTTEQVLHPEKLFQKEQAVAVRAPATPAILTGAHVHEEMLGEQGLRIVLEQWSTRQEAAIAAAGWGGDRYVVARNGDLTFFGWHLVMDTEADVPEVTAILVREVADGCYERKDLGPIAWSSRGKHIAIAAGPSRRAASGRTSAGTCADARKWLDAELAR